MQSKIKATLIVGGVLLTTLIAMGAVANSLLGRWKIQVLGRPSLVNLVMMAVPLLVIVAPRQSLAAYGIVLTPFKYHFFSSSWARQKRSYSEATFNRG
jgi:hypothetical protein